MTLQLRHEMGCAVHRHVGLLVVNQVDQHQEGQIAKHQETYMQAYTFRNWDNCLEDIYTIDFCWEDLVYLVALKKIILPVHLWNKGS